MPPLPPTITEVITVPTTQYLTNIQVSEDLVVEAWTSKAYSGALINRFGAGIIGIYPQEIKPLIEALSKAAEALVEAMPEEKEATG